MTFKGLMREDRKKLESEVISNDARLRLTRTIRNRSVSKDPDVGLINRNAYINISNAVMGLPVYRLEPDDWGHFQNVEFGWHSGEIELIMRRPDTEQLIEILGDMLQQRMLDVGEINEILADDNVSVRFKAQGFDEDISVQIFSDAELQEGAEADEAEHPNIRLLTSRMDRTFDDKDYAGVLHASATIFETLAKLVFDSPNVENETLGTIFEGYRKRSALPAPVLDYILETYKRRNSEPLAGHGATKPPKVSATEASTLVEMTKMCVRLERRLANIKVEAKRPGDGVKQVVPGSLAKAKKNVRPAKNGRKPLGGSAPKPPSTKTPNRK